MKKLLVVSLALCIVMVACQPLEMSARDGVATAKGYLDAAKAHHPECSANPPASSDTCTLIHRGTGAKDAVIDAVNQYCASPSYDDLGGPCAANKNVADHLKAALRDLDQVMADVKTIGGK